MKNTNYQIKDQHQTPSKFQDETSKSFMGYIHPSIIHIHLLISHYKWIFITSSLLLHAPKKFINLNQPPTLCSVPKNHFPNGYSSIVYIYIYISLSTFALMDIVPKFFECFVYHFHYFSCQVKICLKKFLESSGGNSC